MLLLNDFVSKARDSSGTFESNSSVIVIEFPLALKVSEFGLGEKLKDISLIWRLKCNDDEVMCKKKKQNLQSVS